jgi:putative transposase
VNARYRFIEAEKAHFAVRTLCRVMKVSRSGFYDWRKRKPSRRACANAKLLAVITTIFEASKERYGYRRVLRQLRADGHQAGKHRVARLMRENGLRARRSRAYRATTDSGHDHPVADNVLGRDFTAEVRDQAWVGDITYIPTAQGWLYLAVLIDLYSRRVVGWAMSSRIDQNLTLTALRMALSHRQPQPGLIHHTDRGSQYAAGAYQAELERAGVVVSMSRKGNCWDNAPSESFFSTLKIELIHEAHFATRDEATRAILRYLLWYNAQRLHSSTGYLSPKNYEELERLQLTAERAA